MGVAVLNPQYVLKVSSSEQELIVTPPKTEFDKPVDNSNSKPNRNNRNHAKRGSLDLHPTRPAIACSVQSQVKRVMDQVKILKRGEQLVDTPNRTSEAAKEMGLAPKPEQIPTEKVAGLYAGSSMFVASPPPSSVPLPAFLKTKSVATTELCRILRLNLS